MSRLTTFSIFIPLLTATGYSPAVGQSISSPFRIDRWTTEHGLPSHVVQDIEQTSDGFLWVTTTGGIARFDGLSFTTLIPDNAQFSTPRTAALHVTHGDTLWIALEGPTVARVVGNQLTEFPGGRFIDIGQDSEGRIYGISQRGVARFDGQRFRGINTPPMRRGARYRGVARLPQIWLDGLGNTWIRGLVSGQGVLYRLVGDTLQLAQEYQPAVLVPVPSRHRLASVHTRSQVTEVSADDRVLARYGTGANGQPRLVDRQDRVWVATDTGLRVYGSDSLSPIGQLRLGDEVGISRVFEDREGNIWVGTGRLGLFRIQQVPFSTVSATADGSTQIRDLTRGSDTGVLATYASPRRPTLQFGRETLDTFRLASRLPGQPDAYTYYKTLVDSHGTSWSVRGKQGGPSELLGQRQDAPDILFPGRGTDGGIDHRVRILFDAEPMEAVWFVDGRLIHRILPYDSSEAYIERTHELPGGRVTVRDFVADARGTLWVVASLDRAHHLVRIEGSAMESIPIPEANSPVTPRSIAVGNGDDIWIGTYGAGVIRFRDGVFGSVRTRDGLAEETASEILLDDLGNLWMAGNRSVHRVGQTELNDFLDGRVDRVHGVAYTRRDGILNPETSGGEAFRGRDGQLWFPTMVGAAVVLPSLALALDSTPPLVHIQIVTVGDSSTRVRRDVELRPGTRRFEIAYNAASLRNPERLQFDYQLEGFDSDWVHAGTDRRATYTNVPPGQYTFRVRAVNAGGVWSPNDATLQMNVLPYFYQTQWFLVLTAIGLSFAAYGSYTHRIRSLKRREAKLNAVVATRTSELAIAKRNTEDALETVASQADKLRSLDESKSRFFANVSHEFRTPLSLILGPVQDVKDGRHGLVSDQAGQRLDLALRSGQRLNRLVEQLLDIARLEAGVLEMQVAAHDLVPFLRRCAEAFSSMAERAGIDFRVSCPVGGVRVRFDPDQMDKVLANLLGNALKFTPTGGRVELVVRTENLSEKAWTIVEVRDNGPGIPKDQLGLIFDRFHQVDDSAHRTHTGAGIGLALTKELVELHGGSIGVESDEGVGSTFTVRLPVVPDQTEASNTPVTDRGRWSTMEAASPADEHVPYGVNAVGTEDVTTVLVVEDSVDLRDYLREHLEDSFRVLEAGTGVEGLTCARAEVPDLIISDVMMPEMDGNALCEMVKTDPEIDFVPVILLTAKASIESRLTGLEGGADDYLTKPVDMRELLARAHNLIESRRRLRERFKAESRPLPTLPALKPPGMGNVSATLIKGLYSVMAENIGNEDFQVDDLAQAMNMSRSTLYRRLHAATGTSPLDLLLNYRLEQAAQWLKETDANVSEIAYGVGFKSVPHFCTKFKEHLNCTPSKFRRMHLSPR